MKAVDKVQNSQQEGYFSNYYLKIKAAKDITIVRKTKEAAIKAYRYYLDKGRNIEWLGKWVGNKFEETNPPFPA